MAKNNILGMQAEFLLIHFDWVQILLLQISFCQNETVEIELILHIWNV